MLQIDAMTEVINILSNGGIILYPMDTIWGIGCDASNAQAVEKIYALKDRARNKPFVLLADSLDMVEQHVHHVHPRISTLLQHHVRPLTVVYEQAKNLPPSVAAQDGSVAIRIAQAGFCQDLIRAYGKPLVATSANISNQPFPKNFGSISSDVIQGVDYVVRNNLNLDAQDTEPSVIVRLSPKGELLFLRT